MVASLWGVVATAVAVIFVTAWVVLWVRSLWWQMRFYSEQTRVARNAPPRPDEERPDDH